MAIGPAAAEQRIPPSQRPRQGFVSEGGGPERFKQTRTSTLPAQVPAQDPSIGRFQNRSGATAAKQREALLLRQEALERNQQRFLEDQDIAEGINAQDPRRFRDRSIGQFNRTESRGIADLERNQARNLAALQLRQERGVADFAEEELLGLEGINADFESRGLSGSGLNIRDRGRFSDRIALEEARLLENIGVERGLLGEDVFRGTSRFREDALRGRGFAEEDFQLERGRFGERAGLTRGRFAEDFQLDQDVLDKEALRIEEQLASGNRAHSGNVTAAQRRIVLDAASRGELPTAFAPTTPPTTRPPVSRGSTIQARTRAPSIARGRIRTR